MDTTKPLKPNRVSSLTKLFAGLLGTVDPAHPVKHTIPAPNKLSQKGRRKRAKWVK